MVTISLEQAKKIVKEAKEQEEKLKEEQLEKWIDSVIGQCYVYRNNSYGRDSTKWDVFHRIIKKISNYEVLVEEWELIDKKKGIVEIKRTSVFVYDWNLQKGRRGFNNNDWCTLAEFNKNKKQIIDILEIK